MMGPRMLPVKTIILAGLRGFGQADVNKDETMCSQSLRLVFLHHSLTNLDIQINPSFLGLVDTAKRLR
jgi:hypothetical protein